ncbi:MAG: hypothetical protein HYS25_00880 [Ignavibacteriales bacterium]|nr:hypothetical protein [Ignavibacteriales bacterium]
MKNEIDELKIERKQYQIAGKTYYLWDDFDFDEKEWLDIVYGKLSTSPSVPLLGNEREEKQNKVSGSFTSEEMLKTLSILLRNENGSYCNPEIFRKTRESLQVKILADFFLSKAILGIITTGFLKLSEIEKSKLQMTSMN